MSPDDVEVLLSEARGGSPEAERAARGQLLDQCRPYLLLIANQDLDRGIRARVGPSDVVAVTLAEALCAFEKFHGRTEAELRAWLRHILDNNLKNAHRRERARRRDVRQDIPGLNGKVNHLPGREESPSAQVRAQDRAEAVQRALQRLPERARQAIVLRLYEKHTFAQVGEQLGCSEEAARKLFQRAAEELAPLLESLRDDA